MLSREQENGIELEPARSFTEISYENFSCLSDVVP